MKTTSVNWRLIDAVVICLRIGFAIFIIWKSYRETGGYTAIALLSILLYLEVNTIVIKRMLALLKRYRSRSGSLGR
jgi:hypothetical protein